MNGVRYLDGQVFDGGWRTLVPRVGRFTHGTGFSRSHRLVGIPKKYIGVAHDWEAGKELKERT